MDSFAPKTILVPVDLAAPAPAAWLYAKRLARKTGSAVEAVHVANFFEGPVDIARLRLSGPELRDLHRRLLRAAPGAGMVHIVEGDVASGILATARRRRAGLIVMATAGRTGLERLRRVSTTEKVARHSPVPVVCLRGPARLPGSVLAPLNLRPYSLEGFRAARAAARTLGARLTILHVRERGPAMRPLNSLLREADAVRVVDGDPVERILAEAARHDLVVLVAHRKGLLRDALRGTTAEQVLRRCRSAVLVVPEGPRRGRKDGRRRARVGLLRRGLPAPRLRARRSRAPAD